MPYAPIFLLIPWFIFPSDSAWAAADEAPETSLPELVVTGSHFEAGTGEAEAAVRVINREEIASSHVDTVLELLRSVPGLHVDRAGGRGGVSVP